LAVSGYLQSIPTMNYLPNQIPVQAFILRNEPFPDWFNLMVQEKKIIVFRLNGNLFPDYITHCLVREPNGSYLHISRNDYVIYSEITGKIAGMMQFQFETLFSPAPPDQTA
jgi:hypothetical protein